MPVQLVQTKQLVIVQSMLMQQPRASDNIKNPDSLDSGDFTEHTNASFNLER